MLIIFAVCGIRGLRREASRVPEKCRALTRKLLLSHEDERWRASASSGQISSASLRRKLKRLISRRVCPTIDPPVVGPLLLLTRNSPRNLLLLCHISPSIPSKTSFINTYYTTGLRSTKCINMLNHDSSKQTLTFISFIRY